MHFAARLVIHVASIVLVLAAPADADESAPVGPDLILSYSLRGCSTYEVAPQVSESGCRILPEQERPAWYIVALESAEVPRPSDFAATIPALESSLRLHLVQSYDYWATEPNRLATLDTGLSVPIRVERIEPMTPKVWAAWRVVPDFSKVIDQGANHTAVISISAALVHELADVGAKPRDLAIISDRPLDIGPARSPDEVYAREVNDIIQAEDARDWGSLQRHAVALLALDCNSVFGHAFLARSLTEQGKQAEAEIERTRAEALLAERKDARLVAVKEHHPNTRSIEGFMARALCPVHRNATPPRPDDTRCNPGFHYEWGW